MLNINEEEPKSPVNNGKRGSFKLKPELSTRIPSIPLRVNPSNAENFFCSIKMSSNEVIIKI